MVTETGEAVLVAVLGPVVVRGPQGEIPTGSPQQEALLVALALRRGKPAGPAELVDELWGPTAPATASTIVRTYVHRLRRSGLAIESVAGGYRLEVRLDLDEFDALVLAAERTGDLIAAAQTLQEALGRWRGPALAGVVGPGAELRRSGLEARHRNARIAKLEIDLRRRRAQAIEPELRELLAAEPLDEQLCRLLVTALYQLGRQAEALAVYHACRERIAAELGLEPGPELRELYARILKADPGLIRTSLKPAQLPSEPAVFAGRDHELQQDAGPSGILIVTGMGGVGKTALALRWAHRQSFRFTDGQLYADLRGYDPSLDPADTADVLHGFLLALGVAAGDVPLRQADRAARFRTELTGRKMLILLDNASTYEQIQDLLPGAGESVVLVTSRSTLSGLVARAGARVLPLKPPSTGEAENILADRLGRDRVAAEPAAVREIIDYCGRLPLALVVVAARAAINGHVPLAAIAAELRDAHLDALRTPDNVLDVRATLSWSATALKDDTAEVFWNLSAHPGPEITAPAMSAVLGRPVGSALAEIAAAHLLEEHAPQRYRMHDLVRALVAEAEPEPTAVQRLLDYYLQTSYAAGVRDFPARYRVRIDAPAPGSVLNDPPARWFEDERPVLLAVQEHAFRLGFDRHAWQLAWVMRDHLNRRGLWHQLQATQEIGMASAERLDDQEAIAHTLRGLAQVDTDMRRFAAAQERLRRALRIFEAAGDREAVADCRRQIAYVLDTQGDAEGSLAESERVLELYPRGHEPRWRAAALNAVSYSQAQLGRFSSALENVLEAIALGDSLGPYAFADTLQTLAFIQAGMGDRDEAEVNYRRAADLYIPHGALVLAAQALCALAELTGTERAAPIYQEALNLIEDADDPRAPALAAQLRGRLQDVYEL
ncbi:AfsR/SARP family transcriptional regulator [Kineosporia babensis]|uniref:OmpR/PhoB-type domain-containing protein n=1 Tax=Kineosporia babensis TaxID=499548 RepID=A0A9X1NJW1_9ACTN|nr:hypothetical protein [Kineosporia babensis]